jgi:enoyl-CoA hydratase/carnithine racemase
MTGLTISDPVDGVVTVELDRPPANLFTVELCRQLVRLLDEPPAEAHVLRLRAAGDAFCMGREREGSTPAELREEVGVLVALTRALRRTRLVTVAEVQGDAAGFGVGVVAACNVAVAVEGARFSFPEVTIGLAPALVLAWLPRVVGEREAFWLTASGEAVPARRALELGLLNGVVATTDELTKEVDDRIGVLRSHSPRVHADIKDMLRLFAGASDDDVLDVSIDRLVVGSMRRSEQ